MAKAPPPKNHKNRLMLEAYRALGIDATTEALAAHVLEHGGIDLWENKGYLSVLKSTAKKQYRAEQGAAAPRPSSTGETSAVPLKDFAALKEMVGRLGETTVKQLVDLLK